MTRISNTYFRVANISTFGSVLNHPINVEYVVGTPESNFFASYSYLTCKNVLRDASPYSSVSKNWPGSRVVICLYDTGNT